VWLQGIVEESVSTCPQLQRFVRLFALRSPKSMHSKAVKDMNESDETSSVTSTSSSDAVTQSRGQSVDGTTSHVPPMFSYSDIRPRSGSVCSEDSDISDLSDASDGMMRAYVGGPHATTASLCQDYNAEPDNLTTLVEDIPKSFTTPKKARVSPMSVDEMDSDSNSPTECEKVEASFAQPFLESPTKENQEKMSPVKLSVPTTPVEIKLARLGLAPGRMVVVSPQKRAPIRKAIRRPEPPVQAPMPWWADWAVAFCGLSPA